MHELVSNNRDGFDKSIEHLRKEITSLRTGRVSPSLVEEIQVESYGTTTELVQLASISTPEPQTIAIKPWDKNIIKDIEKAILKSDLSINPVVDSDLIRLNFPPLTEESRKELVKILHKKAEETRISIRSHREKVKEDILGQERSKAISEDERFQALKDLDEVVKEYNEAIKQIAEEKEKEIMTI